MIIKDRLIEVDIAEALAIAGKGKKVRCVGEGTGLMTITDALEGLTFFAPESALAENPEPIKPEVSKDEIAKLAKSAFVPGGVVRYDTPEDRTRAAIVDSVERYDEEHGNPPTTRQDAEDAKDEMPKQEEPAPVPFASAPSGGALKK